MSVAVAYLVFSQRHAVDERAETDSTSSTPIFV